MAILVPPTVLHEEDAVLNLPMIANRCKKLVRANIARIDAGQKIARVGQQHFAGVVNDVAIDPQRHLAARERERFAHVLGVV